VSEKVGDSIGRPLDCTVYWRFPVRMGFHTTGIEKTPAVVWGLVEQALMREVLHIPIYPH